MSDNTNEDDTYEDEVVDLIAAVLGPKAPQLQCPFAISAYTYMLSSTEVVVMWMLQEVFGAHAAHYILWGGGFVLRKRPPCISYDEYVNWVSQCCSSGNLLGIVVALEEVAWKYTSLPSQYILDEELCLACKAGCKHLCELMIAYGASDWDGAHEWAAYSGNMELVEFIHAQPHPPEVLDWNSALCGACAAGNEHIVELLFTKGADDTYLGFCCACRAGQLNIVELMLSKSKEYPYKDAWETNVKSIKHTISLWSMGLFLSCQGASRTNLSKSAREGVDTLQRYMQVCRFMINKGATECRHCFCDMNIHMQYLESRHTELLLEMEMENSEEEKGHAAPASLRGCLCTKTKCRDVQV